MSKRKEKRREARERKREFWKGVLYALLGVVLFFQIMAYISVAYGKNLVGYEPPAKIREAEWLLPLLIAMVVILTVAIWLCKLWKNKEKLSLIPMSLSLVGTVLALIIALTFRAGYDDIVNAYGEVGLTDWEWFWQHCTPVIVGATVAVVSFMHHHNLRRERIRKENEAYEANFDFDADNPLLVADDEKPSKKKSKKARKAEKE